VDIPRPVLALYGARPNPAIQDLNVYFSLFSSAPATIVVYDVAGRRVAGTEVGRLGPGHHFVNLSEGRRIRAGVYWILLTQGGRTLTAKAVVIP
jgi:hypothetical protein